MLQASEAAQRLQAGAEQAAKALGWKVTAVDAAGDPTKSESDIVAFVNEGVGAIVDLSNPTAAITQGLAQARAKNIPVINIGGLQNPSPNIEAQYFGDPTDLTAALDKYMFAQLPPHPQIAEFTSQILFDEQLRDAQFEKDAKAAGATVYTYPINLANLSGDATTSSPHRAAGSPAAQRVLGRHRRRVPDRRLRCSRAQNKCASVGNYNFYDDLINLKTIPTGCGTAVTTSPVGADGWAAVDQFAEFFARHKSITSFPPTWNDLQNNIYGVDIRTGNAIEVIDKSNLPRPASTSRRRPTIRRSSPPSGRRSTALASRAVRPCLTWSRRIRPSAGRRASSPAPAPARRGRACRRGSSSSPSTACSSRWW